MQTICRFVARFYDFLWELTLFWRYKHPEIQLLVLLDALVRTNLE